MVNTYTTNKITHFCISPKNLDKWVYQNKAKYEEVFEGCLLNNYLITCKRGYAAVYEKVVNEWSSTFIVFFQPYKNGYEVCSEFYKKMEK